jgi:hypothetical protein
MTLPPDGDSILTAPSKSSSSSNKSPRSQFSAARTPEQASANAETRRNVSLARGNERPVSRSTSPSSNNPGSTIWMTPVVTDAISVNLPLLVPIWP